VRAGRKVFAVEDDDVGVDAGELLGHDVIINPVVGVAPGDIEKVDRVERVFGLHLDRALANVGRDLVGMKHFFERGTENAVGHARFLLLSLWM
jgi:hypothetical protein